MKNYFFFQLFILVTFKFAIQFVMLLLYYSRYNPIRWNFIFLGINILFFLKGALISSCAPIDYVTNHKFQIIFFRLKKKRERDLFHGTSRARLPTFATGYPC